jgi:16S rRNA (guanine1516-N2)-methyltransferase
MIDISIVGYVHEHLREKAQVLAEQLHFVLAKDAPSCLLVTEDKLSLKLPDFSPISAEFNSEFWSKRKSEGKKQGLVRACRPCPGLKIIDATAGWGRDAAVLASFGAEVLMLERHPVMAVLLTDALSRREKQNSQQIPVSLHIGDAYSYLNALAEYEYPDVIYIDPMHPARNKSALVKKEMQALQQMVGSDNDAHDLIQLAIIRVKQRVVVKWPQKVKPLVAANANIGGKTVRFDIYFPRVC